MINIDQNIQDADWPKRTDDHFVSSVPKTLGGVGSGTPGHTTFKEGIERSSVVLHGTALNSLKSILKDGIQPDRQFQTYPEISKPGHVYVTPDMKTAQLFAEDAMIAAAIKSLLHSRNFSPAVVEIQMPPEDLTLLIKDPAADVKEGFLYKGTIKPEWIKAIHVPDPLGELAPWKIVDPSTYRSAKRMLESFTARILIAVSGQSPTRYFVPMLLESDEGDIIASN